MASATAVTQLEVNVLANNVLGGMRTIVCGIKLAAAERFIRREARQRQLAVNGFRSAQAPIGIIYKTHRRLLERCLIHELKIHPPKALSKALGSCITIPEYEVQPWNGKDLLKIQVCAHENPAAPNPGGRFNGLAAANHDQEILQPSLTQASDGLLPAEVARQMAQHGIGLGSSLSAATTAGGGATKEAAQMLGDNIPQQLRPVLAQRLNARVGDHRIEDTASNSGNGPDAVSLRPDKDSPVPLAERRSVDSAKTEAKKD